MTQERRVLDAKPASDGQDDLSEIDKAKLIVLRYAFGICSLPEQELYETLERIYWLGFKSGHEFKPVPSVPKDRLAGWIDKHTETGFHADAECILVRELLEAIESGELQGEG